MWCNRVQRALQAVPGHARLLYPGGHPYAPGLPIDGDVAGSVLKTIGERSEGHKTMRLKRLETYGFKSFADRMTFDFESGITAIIGPNGCGKSNIVDAMKWVVGEQSAKALRGAEMADVIFSGCATRRQMAMAEVTLTLESDGQDPARPDEIALTRRLTRDGQSSYFLNGRPCRLKDIRELLMDTGVGISAYSVIEQGRISFILEASIKDRRAILEEAAGISRYKARRRAAERRLERVQISLERIEQVLREVGRRLGSVRRQAATALRYQELSERLRDLRMVFALEEYGRLSTEAGEHQQALDGLSEDQTGLSARLGELDATLSAADVALVALEQDLRRLEEERGEARSRRDVAAAQLTEGRARLIEIDQVEADDRRMLVEIDEKLATNDEERQRTQASLEAAAAGQDKELAALYQEQRNALDAVLERIDQQISVIEERKSRDVEVLRELARVDAEAANLKNARTGLAQRRTRIEERSRDHGDSLEQVREIEAAALAAVREHEEHCATEHARLDELIRTREQAQADGERCDGRLNDLRHEQGQAEVRLRLLSEYERKHEGLQRGVKDVIQQMGRLSGIHGIVADCFRVAKEHELAIETALGGRAQNIITDSQEAAKAAIEFLKRERRGRATFLPLDDIRGAHHADKALLKETGVVGEAVDLVHFEPRYRAAFAYLLGGIIVCETLDHALALRRRHSPRGMLVTLDGEVINAGGAMTGGRAQGGDTVGLVSRKNEITRLEQRLAELATELAELGTARDAARKHAFDCAVQVEEQRRCIQQAERATSDAKAEATKAERDRSHAEQFAASFGGELEELAAELARIERDAQDLAGQQQWFSALRDRTQTELEELQQVLATQAQERDSLQETVANLRVDLATTEERREALRNHLGHLNRQRSELEDQRTERTRRLAQQNSRRTELTQAITDNEQVHEVEKQRFETLSTSLEEVVRQRDQTRQAVEEERQEQRRLSTRLRSVEQRSQEHAMQLGEIRVRLETMAQRILEDYALDIDEAYRNYERPADLDLPALRRELAGSEQELASLGPVNLASIDELKEVEARHGFLQGNLEDLSAARDKLSDIITTIDDTSRRLFKRTYKAVRGHFGELFRKLYGGGKADLVLQYEAENDDILEAGIEIIAQPPGKQPKSITLLSGGEKALTAIALLFAVYQTKPSPFCILDEVDAPLDESNTDVYCQMVREFCARSQFLVVTHNKRTMQYADAIYGVTQHERGISTKISVKLEDVEQGVDGVLAHEGPFAVR